MAEKPLDRFLGVTASVHISIASGSTSLLSIYCVIIVIKMFTYRNIYLYFNYVFKYNFKMVANLFLKCLF